MDKSEERRLYERVVLGQKTEDKLGMLFLVSADLLPRFRKIKEAWHFEDDESVVTMLITKEWEKIK